MDPATDNELPTCRGMWVPAGHAPDAVPAPVALPPCPAIRLEPTLP
ncbi:hypothetical protein [Komagataeibacter melaceti]|nr:hypothetical protein [Komagataeibacter melaceti]